MTTADLTTITKASRGVQSLHVRYATGLNTADRLSHPSNSFDIEFESSICLIPIPWPINEKLCIPYDNADIPFLKKLLFSSDCGLISKSLQALVERAYDGFKAMYMLRLDIFSPLNRLTKIQNPFIRQRCCILIRILAGQPTGKVLTVRNVALVRNILTLMADEDYRVRFQCALTVMSMADHRPGNEAMIVLGCGDRALERVYAEHDERVVPVLMRIVGLLMTRCTELSRTTAVDDDLSRGPRTDIITNALRLVACSLQPVTTGRGLLDYLKKVAKSSDYKTALDSVACMSRAATVREANEYLARDRDTVELLVSFASSSSLRGRALRVFSAQLLCTMAGTTSGLAHIHRVVTNESENSERWYEDNDPAAERYLRKLAYVIGKLKNQNLNAEDDD